MHDWTPLWPLYKHLRLWLAGVEIFSSHSHPTQAKFPCLSNLSPPSLEWSVSVCSLCLPSMYRGPVCEPTKSETARRQKKWFLGERHWEGNPELVFDLFVGRNGPHVRCLWTTASMLLHEYTSTQTPGCQKHRLDQYTRLQNYLSFPRERTDVSGCLRGLDLLQVVLEKKNAQLGRGWYLSWKVGRARVKEGHMIVHC